MKNWNFDVIGMWKKKEIEVPRRIRKNDLCMKYNAEIIGETGLNEANFNFYFQKKMDEFSKIKAF